jgi:type I restriction enzyme S subunit
MGLLRYPESKESGVAWLGKVPSHWQVHRLKNLFEIRKRIVGEEGHQVLSITQRGIKVKDIESNDGQLSMDYSKYQIVHPGDFAMNHMDLLTGFVDISPYAGVTSPDYRVFAVRDGVQCEPRYFLYLLQNAYRQKIFYAFGQGASEFGRWRFPTDQFNDFRFPCPPSSEQTAIATFLDRETGKIDALVAEQEKLLALLAEKRQATISHAVTKGLNPDAPMKDSGVAWLGKVPEHWGMKRIKDCGCEVVDCKNRTPEPHPDGDYFVVRTSCVKDGRFDPEPGYRTDERNFIEWTAKGKPQTGDVLFTREAPTGEACLAPQGLDFCLGQRMMYIRPPEQVLRSEFLLYSIYGGLARERISEKSKGSTVGHLRVGEVGELPLLLPPLDEQRELVEFVADELNKLQSLEVESERAIALLKKRRSALIAAAVTGQIDVRGLVIEPEAA